MKSKLLILLFVSLVLSVVSFSNEISNRLLVAVRKGNLSKVRILVNRGININKSIKGFLPLVEAANKKHKEIVKYLISCGADVNLQDKDGDTALIVAALRGSLDTVNLLIEKGAKIDVQNKKGKTALMYAIYGNHLNVVKYLLRKNADVLKRYSGSNDALTLAIIRKNRNIIKILLENGAAVTMRHLKLALKLYYILTESMDIFKIDKSKYPQLSKILETPYLIKKDINYHHHSKLTKTVVSCDKKRKAEVYDNGVIKIYDLKTGKFIKAFGGIQFIKDVKYPMANKLFIKKFWNMKLNLLNKYLLYKKNPYKFPYIAEYTFYTDEGFLNLNDIKYKSISGIVYNSRPTYSILSTTGKYFTAVNVAPVVTGFLEFRLLKTESRKIIYKFIRWNNYLPWINFYHPPILSFSFNDRYMLIKFYGKNAVFAESLPESAILVLDIQKRKFVLKKIFKTEREKIKFAKNKNALIVDYGNGRKHLIGLE